MDPTYTHAKLLENIEYQPDTGFFFRKTRAASTAPAGSRADTNSVKKYKAVTLIKQRTYAHRVAWFYMTGQWPSCNIDHINGNGADNRWENLREASVSQNMWNSKTPKNNRCGIKGVCYVQGPRKEWRWRARVTEQGREHSTYHRTQEQAIAAVRSKRTTLHGEFTHHGDRQGFELLQEALS